VLDRLHEGISYESFLPTYSFYSFILLREGSIFGIKLRFIFLSAIHWMLALTLTQLLYIVLHLFYLLSELLHVLTFQLNGIHALSLKTFQADGANWTVIIISRCSALSCHQSRGLVLAFLNNIDFIVELIKLDTKLFNLIVDFID